MTRNCNRMMGMPVIENLKGFATSKPPLIVFMICMGLFAVVLLSLAYYVKMHEIENPDISQDWNIFLENFSELEFCMSNTSAEIQNSTNAPTKGPTSKAKTKTEDTKKESDGKHKATLEPSKETSATTTHPEYENLRNYSVQLSLTVHPSKDFLSIHHNITHVSGTLLGSQLGLKDEAANEMINIMAELPFDWNASCSQAICSRPVTIVTCVHFIASPVVFPASKSPPVCENINETGVEYHTQVRAYEPQLQYQYPTFFCKSKSIIKVHYKFNPGLTVYLSMRDRSVINLHLMHTSYFLFVMVVTLLCYAIIRGRPHKKMDLQEALISSSNQA